MYAGMILGEIPGLALDRSGIALLGAIAIVAGATLALASTLAGNLFVVGSIANIIVVEQASRQGLAIDWKAHARTGVPVTLTTLAIAAAWLWIRGG